MRKLKYSLYLLFLFFILPSIYAKEKDRRLSVEEYIDKMKAGWIGQMAGVGWGGPTEFKWRGEIIPADKVPKWKPKTINQYGQDDIYVEMTFLRTLEEYGLDVSIRQAGIDFANSKYGLAHANGNGRNNLRKGIAPPDSGHPRFNKHADDIDYQIEADFSGLISPGLPNMVIQLGEKFGRLMNYGDGVYGGQFVGAMYAEAFFEKDIEKIVRAGLKCIPKKSQYYECINDVLNWYKENPDDWEKTWNLINNKYHLNKEYRRFSCKNKRNNYNIDAKINGAYIVIGLLYGKGDPDQTIIISTRCGQDSDCNPSNAAGILFTMMGYSKLPEKFISALDNNTKFSFTAYDFPGLIKVCEKLARKIVIKSKGSIKKDANNNESFVIPLKEPVPTALEQCWEPGPPANSKFFPEEMKKITGKNPWTKKAANDWYAKQPWLVGFNYVPSYACNTTEWWQKETFDPETIDRELGWAADIGYNTTRVMIQYIVWKENPKAFKKRFNRFLDIAAKHNISVMPVLFDDCSFGSPKQLDPFPGKQREPIPGMILPSWTPSPGRKLGKDPQEREMLKKYVIDMIASFKSDKRIIIWDLFNEPGNSAKVGNVSFIRGLFSWAREASPTQPLTIDAWGTRKMIRRIIALSDIITFHIYADYNKLKKSIKSLRKHNRPVICTEWMARSMGSDFAADLPLFKKENVGCYQWGLVNGRTQAQFPWSNKPGGKVDLEAGWFCDILHKDGTPYRKEEIDTIKKIIKGE